MTRPFKALFASSAILLTIGASAMANPAADIDQDGKISKSEFIDAANQRFLETDIDGNKVITEHERETHRTAKHAQKKAEVFDKMDANSDGVISRTEFTDFSEARQERRDARRDFNGDGEYDRADRQARRQKLKERWEQRAERGEKHEGRGWRPDANKDGVITWEEHQAASEKMFEHLDRNDDGFLEEGENRRRKMRHHMRRH